MEGFGFFARNNSAIADAHCDGNLTKYLLFSPAQQVHGIELVN
jgi:hypothetical protein